MLFKPICRQVAKEVEENTLIPSPSIDESKRLLPLNVVTMKMKRKYFVLPVAKDDIKHINQSITVIHHTLTVQISYLSVGRLKTNISKQLLTLI
jgi:hypothetical protein